MLPAVPSEADPNLLFRECAAGDWLSLSRAGPETSLISKNLSRVECRHLRRVSGGLAIGLQIQAKGVSSRSITDPFRKALLL